LCFMQKILSIQIVFLQNKDLSIKKTHFENKKMIQ